MRIVTFVLSVVTFLMSCDSADIIDPKIQGCTDLHSLDFDQLAEEDDGSCTYSRVSFYTAVEPVDPVFVYVGGVNIGTITSFYVSAPENCSSQGNVAYQLTDGDIHVWEAFTGALVDAGTVVANRDSECIIQRTF